MKWKVHPNGQLAKIADGKTVMKSVGEVHETFCRNNWTVKFSALIMQNLHTNIIAGNNFILDNKIKQDFNSKSITVHNKYIVPETNRNVELPAVPVNTIINIDSTKTVLPKQKITVPVPHDDDTKLLVDAVHHKQTWPQSQICIVRNSEIEIDNLDSTPSKVKSSAIALRTLKEKSNFESDPSFKSYAKSNINKNHFEGITTNENRLNKEQKGLLYEILHNNTEVFDENLSVGYNQCSGPHYCKLNFANNERPSAKKVHCVQYNNQLNVLLQQVCDRLTDENVLGIPQHENIQIQHVMPCFLRRKQKARDKPNSQ